MISTIKISSFWYFQVIKSSTQSLLTVQVNIRGIWTRPGLVGSSMLAITKEFRPITGLSSLPKVQESGFSILPEFCSSFRQTRKNVSHLSAWQPKSLRVPSQQFPVSNSPPVFWTRRICNSKNPKVIPGAVPEHVCRKNLLKKVRQS